MERTHPLQTPTLPGTVRVIVRDWLNANNIVLLQPGHNVVVEIGYLSHAHHTLALLRQPQHLGAEPLQLVVNTHCHSDHMGGNALLARTYGCPVAVPEGEAALIRNWDTRALWLDFADQRADRFAVGARRSLPASATVGASSTGRPSLRRGYPRARAAVHGRCRRSGSVLPARKDIRRRSHPDGPPRAEGHADVHPAGASAPATQQVVGLHRRSPVYREYNRMYFGLAPSALLEVLVSELERAGAVTRSGGFLMPAVRDA